VQLSASTYLAGVGCLAVMSLAWAIAAIRWRRRLLPDARGAEARLVEVVLWLAGVVVVAEVVGAFGGFHRTTLTVSSVAVALVLASLGRGTNSDDEPQETTAPDRPVGVLSMLVAGISVVAATAQWLSGTLRSESTGILDVESLHYHLSHAANFVQTGTLWRPHEVSASSDAAFHPLNVELLHSIGMLTLRSDFLSLFINVALLWIAFLAAWVAGARRNAGPLALVLTALLSIAVPLGGRAGGTASNDIAVLALLLAAVAVADRRTDDIAIPAAGRLLVAGLALGLAFGTKLTAPSAVLVLVVGWLLIWGWRNSGWGVRAAALLWGTVAAGVFWYVRDWWFFGSPVPSANLSAIGLTHVPSPAIDPENFSVAHYATDPAVIRHWFVPGLHAFFGALWPGVLLLALLGVLLAARPGRSRFDRVLAAAAAVSFVVYLGTPSGALGPPGHPVLFTSNLRYVTPALVLGLIALARDPWVARRRWIVVVPFALEIITLAESQSWPAGHKAKAMVGAVGLILVVGAAALAARRLEPRLVAVLAVVSVAAVAVAGLPALRHYEHNRYAHPTSPLAAVFAHSAELSNDRVGLVGFPQTYPFYGPRFRTPVQYVAAEGPHHVFLDYTSCASWVDGVNASGVNALVVLTQTSAPDKYEPFVQWTSDAGGRLMFSDAAGAIFAVPTDLSADGCA
jgi:hypothetical protein